MMSRASPPVPISRHLRVPHLKPNARRQMTVSMTPWLRLVLRDANPRRALLDPHTLEAAQEGNECVGVVGGEGPTDLQLPKRWCGDLDRLRSVAIKFGHDTLQRLIVKDDLSTQPGRGALCVDSCRCGRPCSFGHSYLQVGANLD